MEREGGMGGGGEGGGDEGGRREERTEWMEGRRGQSGWKGGDDSTRVR